MGSYLLRLLLMQGYKNITALKREESQMDLVQDLVGQVNWQSVDILDLPYLDEVFQDKEWVFHCAAKVSYHSSEKKEIHRTNVEGTANVVNLCLQYGVKRLLHVSSTAAIGRTKPGVIISEKTKWNRHKLNTNYAISKYLAEQEVWRGMAEGLKIVIVNPSIILGSGFWNGGTQTLFQLANRSFPFYPSGQNGFIDVRDVVQFMVLLMESDIEGERFLLNSENLQYGKVLSLIAENLGTKPPSIPTNTVIKFLSWRLEWLKSKFTKKSAFITKESVQQASNRVSFDNTKSVKTFNFNYQPIERTIQETCKQFIESKAKKLKARYLPFDTEDHYQNSSDEDQLFEGKNSFRKENA